MLTLDIHDAVVESKMTTLYIGLCIFLSFISIVASKNNNKNSSSLFKHFCSLMVFIYLITIIHSFYYPLGSRNQYGEIILPLMLFVVMSRIKINDRNTIFIIWSITAIVILLAYSFYTEYITTVVFGLENRNNASYYSLYFLPFLLCHNKRMIRYISIAIILFVVLISLKRGGFLALMMALAVYFYVFEISIKGRHIKVWGIISFISASALIVFIVIYLNTSLLEGMLFNRIEQIDETGGANRMYIYERYLSFIYNSPIDSILFGRGWEGSIRDSNVGMTCHNDFMECFVDFGLFGFILYILLYVTIIKMFISMVKLKHKYAPAMGASIALLCMNSMVSHILIYPWYLSTFALFWGFIVASTSHIIKNK